MQNTNPTWKENQRTSKIKQTGIKLCNWSWVQIYTKSQWKSLVRSILIIQLKMIAFSEVVYNTIENMYNKRLRRPVVYLPPKWCWRVQGRNSSTKIKQHHGNGLKGTSLIQPQRGMWAGRRCYSWNETAVSVFFLCPDFLDVLNYN